MLWSLQTDFTTTQFPLLVVCNCNILLPFAITITTIPSNNHKKRLPKDHLSSSQFSPPSCQLASVVPHPCLLQPWWTPKPPSHHLAQQHIATPQSWNISHPVDDLGLGEPVVQVMAELLLADQFPLGESQGEAGKDEKGPGGAIEMVENL